MANYRFALASFCAGILLSFSFAPFNDWLLGLASLCIYVWALGHSKNTHPCLSGWAYGLGLFGSGSSWVYYSIHDYGNANPALSLLLVGIFTGGLALFHLAFAWCYTQLKRQTPLPQLMLFPLLWVIFEWLRSWVASGFPWLYVGYAHTNTWFAGWAPLLGVYGISFIIALSAGALCLILKRKHLGLGFSTLLMVMALSQSVKQIEWAQPIGNTVNIGVIQPNISLHDKWNKAKFIQHIHQMSRQTQNIESSDIIIWPEAAIPGHYPGYKVLVNHLVKQAQHKNYTLIAGMPYKEDKKYYNSQWVSPQTGVTPRFYLKKHLVPFGEYVPFEAQLRGLIGFFDLPSSHFSEGNTQQAQLFAKGLPLAIYICYEVAFPDLVASGLGQSTLLITVSNDAWFGDSIGPHQHYQIAQMRALELGRPMVRATNNGISGIINHKGQSVFEAEQFKQTEFIQAVQPYTGYTPFARYGSLPFISICTLLIMLLQKPIYSRLLRL